MPAAAAAAVAVAAAAVAARPLPMPWTNHRAQPRDPQGTLWRQRPGLQPQMRRKGISGEESGSSRGLAAAAAAAAAAAPVT